MDVGFVLLVLIHLLKYTMKIVIGYLKTGGGGGWGGGELCLLLLPFLMDLFCNAGLFVIFFNIIFLFILLMKRGLAALL